MKKSLLIFSAIAIAGYAAAGAQAAQRTHTVKGPQGPSVRSTVTGAPGAGITRTISTSGGGSVTQSKSYHPTTHTVDSALTTAGGKTLWSRTASLSNGSITGPQGNTVTRQSSDNSSPETSSSTFSGSNGGSVTSTTTRQGGDVNTTISKTPGN